MRPPVWGRGARGLLGCAHPRSARVSQTRPVAAMASVDLSSSSINLQKVRDDAAGNLINALESRAGRKALVLDPKLGPPLMSLVNMQTLKGLEVDKLYYLQGGTLETSCQEVVFIIRPRLELMHKLAEVVLGIREDINSHNQHANANVAAGNRPGNRTLLRTKKRMPTFTVFTVPRTSDACATILKHLGVYEHLVMRKLEIDAVPVERDVFLVEHGNAWRDLAVERDTSSLFDTARALHELQQKIGEIPLVFGKGTAAKEVAEIMERLRRERFAAKERGRDRWPNDANADGDGKESVEDDASGSDDDDEDSPRDSQHDSSEEAPDSAPFSKKRTDWGMDHGGLPVGPDGWTKTKTKTKKKKEEAPPGSFSVRVENRETAFGDLPTGTPQADMLLLIDRDVDMVTPLCTQTTYEGLIDEVLGFSGGGLVSFEQLSDDAGDAERTTSSDTKTSSTVKARLDSTDRLFREIRDLNFGDACVVLKEKSSAMQREYREMRASAGGSSEAQDGNNTNTNTAENSSHKKTQMSVSEIGGFVKKMTQNVKPGAGLSLHTAIAGRLLASTRGNKHWQRVRFGEVLDSERLCMEGDGGVLGGTNLTVAGNSFGSNFNTVYERLTLMIFRECNVRRVARLLALVCLTFGGLPPKRFDEIRKEMTHQYGPPTLLLLLHMEQAGLLFRSEERHSGSAGAGHKSSSKNAAAVKKRTEGFMNTRGKLKLVVDDTSSFGDGRSDASSSGIDRKGAPPPKRDIGGVAFAHSGYCPISVRVALSAVDGSWKKTEETLRLLPGPHFSYTQSFSDDDGVTPNVGAINRDWFDVRRSNAQVVRRDTAGGNTSQAQTPQGKKKPVVIVFFVGGVTRAEISCFRFASRHMSLGIDFVIGATSITNGFGVVDSLIDDERVFDALDRNALVSESDNRVGSAY